MIDPSPPSTDPSMISLLRLLFGMNWRTGILYCPSVRTILGSDHPSSVLIPTTLLLRLV